MVFGFEDNRLITIINLFKQLDTYTLPLIDLPFKLHFTHSKFTQSLNSLESTTIMLAVNLLVALSVVAGVFADSSVLSKRFTRSKLDQFSGTYW